MSAMDQQPLPARTQVGIVGAGPAGLLLGRLLELQGIETVVIEARTQEYVQKRVRAGLLEQGTVDLMIETGVGERLKREALPQRGLEFRFAGQRHRIPVTELTGGKRVNVYGQQEVVKDLVHARRESGAPLLFEAPVVEVAGIDTDAPVIRYREGEEIRELRCDVVAGCDGFHGVARHAVPAGVMTERGCEYPYGWLGILADAPPSNDEIIYAWHERGMALHSMRSPEVSRLYIQCAPDEDLAKWTDDQIWDELEARLAIDDDWTLNRGPIREKGVTGMRSFVLEPMQYGRLYLAGDAAHIVPPTGAKGLNLAAADVRTLAAALTAWFAGGDESLLDAYSATCLERIWRAQHNATWLTKLLHRSPDAGDMDARLQLAELEYVCTSPAGRTMIAENYVGLDPVSWL
ncbi:MAG: p-hydroxybenzoate 3-monooxygenase [Solirubrobacteraceae bacterium]|jgi:p-hydroxybenzoate 3-monooxygenase|nr:p-hydroxybenzoate 3-monooxygenase [Solirubrobacteraceae bacterium]